MEIKWNNQIQGHSTRARGKIYTLKVRTDNGVKANGPINEYNALQEEIKNATILEVPELNFKNWWNLE